MASAIGRTSILCSRVRTVPKETFGLDASKAESGSPISPSPPTDGGEGREEEVLLIPLNALPARASQGEEAELGAALRRIRSCTKLLVSLFERCVISAPHGKRVGDLPAPGLLETSVG